MRRATLTDVARQAGVGKATASRALRGLANVSPASARAVAVAATRLGYRPDPLLAAMGRYRWPHGRRVRPALIAHLQDAWMAMHETSRRSLQQRAERLGYGVVHRVLAPSEDSEGLWSELLEAGVVGVVIDLHAGTPPLSPPPDGLVGVVTGESQPHLKLPRIASDWSLLARLATERLRRLGHRRIGHVIQRFACPELTRELTAAALACHSVEGHGGLVCVVPGGLASARRAVAEWCTDLRPTAVVADSPGLLAAVPQLGRQAGSCAFATLIGGGSIVSGRTVSGFVLDLAWRAEKSIEHLHDLLLRGQVVGSVSQRLLLSAEWIQGDTIEHVLGARGLGEIAEVISQGAVP